MSTIEFEGVNLRGTPAEFLHKLIVSLRQPGVRAVMLTLDETVPAIAVELVHEVKAAPAASVPAPQPASPAASLGKISGRGEVRDPEPKADAES